MAPAYLNPPSTESDNEFNDEDTWAAIKKQAGTDFENAEKGGEADSDDDDDDEDDSDVTISDIFPLVTSTPPVALKRGQPPKSQAADAIEDERMLAASTPPTSTLVTKLFPQLKPKQKAAVSYSVLIRVMNISKRPSVLFLYRFVTFKAWPHEAISCLARSLRKTALLALLPKQYKNSDFMAELFAYSAFERPLLEKNSGESMKVLFKKFYSCFSLRLDSVTHLSIYPGACFHLFLRKTCSKALQLSNTGNHRIGILYSKTHKIIEILHLIRSRFLPVSN